MAVNITVIGNSVEVCRTFGSIFEIGESKTLKLGIVNIKDVKTASLGKNSCFFFRKSVPNET